MCCPLWSLWFSQSSLPLPPKTWAAGMLAKTLLQWQLNVRGQGMMMKMEGEKGVKSSLTSSDTVVHFRVASEGHCLSSLSLPPTSLHSSLYLFFWSFVMVFFCYGLIRFKMSVKITQSCSSKCFVIWKNKLSHAFLQTDFVYSLLSFLTYSLLMWG